MILQKEEIIELLERKLKVQSVTSSKEASAINIDAGLPKSTRCSLPPVLESK